MTHESDSLAVAMMATNAGPAIDPARVRKWAAELMPWLAEHDAEVWEAGVDAMASASIMRMNTNDVKRNNPHRGSHHAGCYLLTQRDLSHDNCDCLCHPSRENKRPDHG